jgi:hypothetical protein
MVHGAFSLFVFSGTGATFIAKLVARVVAARGILGCGAFDLKAPTASVERG